MTWTGSMLSQMCGQKSWRFLHVTSRYEEIIKQRSIYASGGCLVGSIYCTPLLEQDGLLRLHNLGSYYYLREAPSTCLYRGKMKNWANCTASLDTDEAQVRALIVEITPNGKECLNLKGVNYLRLGHVHYNVFRRFKHLLTRYELDRIAETILSQVEQAKEFLSVTLEMASRMTTNNDSAEYLMLFRDNVKHLSVLGYIYFEVLSRYIMLHQDDDVSERYRGVNEIYNWHYKDLVFSLYPDFLGRFELARFNPDPRAVIDYLTHNGIVKNFDSTAFVEWLVKVMVNLTLDSILCDVQTERDLEIPRRIELLDGSSTAFIPLIGHILHREIRKYEQYDDFYLFFERVKALEAWNHWNRMEVAALFNSVIFKGEMGINPAYIDEVSYQVYECEGVSESNGFYYTEKGRPLDVKIIPRLIDLDHSFLRSTAGFRCTRPASGSQRVPDLRKSLESAEWVNPI